MLLHGNDIFISIDGSTTAYALTRSNEIQSEADKTEVSSPATEDWKEYLPGRKGWSFTVAWLLASGQDVLNLLKVGTTVTVKIMSRWDSTTVLLEGQAICTMCKGTFTRGNLAQGSFQFVGNGELAPPVTPDPETDDSDEDDSGDEE